MRDYNRTQRVAWAILLATGAVKNDELEQFGISKKKAESWANHLLNLKLTVEDALEAVKEEDDELATKYILRLCLDERHYIKQKQDKAPELILGN
ncbi:hypothetical protein [Thalassotalea mangrovi]|uniref:Uncharacterized protein n=1 Tax=Thalassotalea mangrovi TaxID=2572245 RepID=A0A4U1B2X6_9GAMM|nr:hypothetical protein [Thalassotalea mangrovi]TKB43555.1 hypothetical protein E8M12_14770 [Thalassotalea mangrovi]